MKLMLLSKDDQYPLKIDQYITGYKIKIKTDPKANARVHVSNLEMMVTLEVPYVDRENKHLKEQIETLIQWALLPLRPENHYYRDLSLHMTAGNGVEKTIVFTHAELYIEIENSTKKNYEVLTVIAKQKMDKTEGVLFGVDLEETYEKAWAIPSNRLQANIVASLPSLGANTLMFSTKIPSLRPKEDYDYKYKVTFKTGNRLDHKGTYYEIKENKTGKYITISSKKVYLSEFKKDGYKIDGQEENVVEPKYINTGSGKKREKKGLKTIKFTYKRELVGLRITKPDGKQLDESYKCFYKDGKTYIMDVEPVFKFIGYKCSNNGRSRYSITGFGKTHTITILKGSDAFEKNNYILLSDLSLALEKDFAFTWSGKCWSNNPKKASIVLKTKGSGNRSYKDFRDAVGFRESTDNYQAVNQYGYMGRYQFGLVALQDIGFKDDNKKWTEKAKTHGVSSDQDFLNTPSAQDAAFNLLMKKQLSYIKHFKLDSYIGKKMNGVLITESGLTAASHLIGIGGIKQAIDSNDLTSVKDGNGVEAKEYVELFGGYDLSEIK